MKSTILVAAVVPPSQAVVPPAQLMGFEVAVVGIAVSLVSALAAGAVSWAFARSVRSVDHRIDKLDLSVSSLDLKHRELELHIANHYLKIDDFIRNTNAVDAKLEGLHRKIDLLMERKNG
ncbi:hypothetical protein [Synechococcus sp. PCC 6312]|uniref:hypothetical protein n=1 Tax=Synechococcus sp. (strain ATCC 27167 / PCC 6312) TaxID=195253 RepID=UPI00029EC656|nr:hypothetical protein [Synechococcus sp. PCC 6312]AFY60342.1 hypothetical protein Syn6312_1154 [Synechococcus sp. PCC 6312]